MSSFGPRKPLAPWLRMHEAKASVGNNSEIAWIASAVAKAFSPQLGLDGRAVDFVITRVRGEWGAGVRTISVDAVQELGAEFGGGDPEATGRWVAIAEAASHGEYGVLLELLIEQNRWVMEYRGGAPWLEQRDGRLHVRFRDEEGPLPSRGTLSSLWRFPYFLDSLRQVALDLRDESNA